MGRQDDSCGEHTAAAHTAVKVRSGEECNPGRKVIRDILHIALLLQV